MKELPEKIDKYPVIGLAGHGNMAVVYVGHDPFRSRDVAIKVCKTNGDGGGNSPRVARKLFFNEAQAAGSLDHPNIVKVLDAGEGAEGPYIVMELVDGGKTLASHTSASSLLPIEQVGEIGYKCAMALDYAHRRGVIHRDIKPSNLMLMADGEVKIGDFGVAQRHLDDSTQVLGIVGTPQYLSPEQVDEGNLTTRTDIYSLGVVLYQLFTGSLPYKATGLTQLFQAITREEPPELHALRPELPEGLDPIIRRAMAKDPVRRYPSGAEMACDLLDVFERFGRAAEQPGHQEKLTAVRVLPFFNEFSDTELADILRVGSWETYAPGQVIITEGNPECSFCVLVMGEVVVTRQGHELTSLHPGDCFGEMAFLSETKRSASIVAATNVSVLRISDTQMNDALASCQVRFQKMFLRTLVERLERTSGELTDGRGHPDSLTSSDAPPAMVQRRAGRG